MVFLILGWAGLFKQGFELSFGMIGKEPGTIGQMFFTFGILTTPAYVNGSVSAQLIGVRFRKGLADVSGKGRTWGIGASDFSGSFSQGLNNDRTKVTTDAVGIVVGMVLRYTGGYVETNTWAIPVFFSMFLVV